MLNQPTMERLQAMKLYGMAEAFREQYESTDSSQLSFEERFGLLVDRQWSWKENRALTRRLQMAKFKERGVIEDIDYQHPRGLDRRLMRTLASSDWVRQHQNLLLIGPTGIGKSWLACALAHKACRDGFFALHKRMAELFRDLAMARADGSIGSLLGKLARTDVLVLDDFAMAPMKDSERRDFLEICDDRYQRRSTVLTSQMPMAHWHEQIGDPSLADSILDRLVHNAHRLELNGESIRKKRGRKPVADDGSVIGTAKLSAPTPTTVRAVVSQLNLGIGKRTSGYWSHLYRGAQIVFNFTSARRRLKLF